jgi:hypothetical protein
MKSDLKIPIAPLCFAPMNRKKELENVAEDAEVLRLCFR